MDYFGLLQDNYKIKLNDQQKEAVTHVSGPALVLAGPGSGKTTVITARTAYLIMDKGVDPDSILTLTFNRAAKNEMEHRFQRIFGKDIGKKPQFSTIHSFCNMVVRDYEFKQGRRLKRIEGDEASGDSKRKILRSIHQTINNRNINDDEMENLINEIGLVKNKMIRNLEDNGSGIKNFAMVFNAYEDYKKSHYCMDFDDMLTFAYAILNKCPDILSFYINKYKFLQVDEGQDLSKIQFEVLKLLMKRTEKNIFFVADDDQSIYGFRGAEPQYILDIKSQYSGCNFYKLENNYRSSQNIVEISSKFIKSNKDRFNKDHRTLNVKKKDPFIVKVVNDVDQMDFLKNTLKEKMNSNEVKEIAVLYRNNLSSIVILDILDRCNLSVKIKQNKLFFFKHWVVQDVMAFLKFSLDQTDIDSFSRIYYKMNRYISKTMLEQAIYQGYSDSVIDGIIKSGEVKPFQMSTLKGLKSEFRQLSKKTPLEALKYIEFYFNYFDSVEDYCENTGLSFDYLYGLFGILKALAEKCDTVPEFLERFSELELIIENPKPLKPGKHVTLTTLHSSKGLEYDCVIMVDLVNSEIPGKRALDQSSKKNENALLEEERRLFYVGMTRAKSLLYLVVPQIKNGVEEKRSIFVDEVSGIMNLKTLDVLGEGVIVYHKKFGRGVITTVNELGVRTVLEINFGGKLRKVDFDTCIQKGLLVID